MSLNNMTMTFGTVTYRQDGALWWAEDSEMPGWTAVGVTQQEVQRLHGEVKLLGSLQRELDAARARAEVLAEALDLCRLRLEASLGTEDKTSEFLESIMRAAERAGGKPWRDTKAILAARYALAAHDARRGTP